MLHLEGKEESRALGRFKAMSEKEPGTFVMWECIPVPCLEPQYRVMELMLHTQHSRRVWPASVT